MGSKFQVSLVSNAGVLIQIGTTKILLDALWAQSDAYSSPPPDIYEQMLHGDVNSKWRNVDFLIFTHLHNDHFDQHKVIEYLEHNRVCGVLFDIPNSADDNIAEHVALTQYLDENKTKHHKFDLQRGEYRQLKLTADIEITAICTQHMGINAHQNHMAIVVHSDGKNILFVTDAEFPLPIFKQVLAGLQPDAVFLNPVHFYSKRALSFVVDELAAKLLVAYHIPFAGEGHSVFRRMVSKKLPTVEKQLPTCVLWSVGDCVTI